MTDDDDLPQGNAVLYREDDDDPPQGNAVVYREDDDDPPQGNAVVYCEGAFGTANGKTAHGLVRRTRRYRVVSVVDSRRAGDDAGVVLDGRPNGIHIVASLDEALRKAAAGDRGPISHMVVGQTPDGGRLGPDARGAVEEALRSKLHVVCGSHDFFSGDPELSALARERGVTITDVRKPPNVRDLHFFTGRIAEVKCLKVAVLGTDSAVGKRTTALVIEEALADAGFRAALVGTGQTSWMQGVRHCIIMDSLVNDFVAGEIEHAVWSAWRDLLPDVILIEGQGSLMNPAYPGGFEILAAGRPDAVIMQHPPARKEYDGFPGFPLHPVSRQIEAVRIISDRPVVAVTVNHEGLDLAEVPAACEALTRETGLPAFDVLLEGAEGVVEVLRPLIEERRSGTGRMKNAGSASGEK